MGRPKTRSKRHRQRRSDQRAPAAQLSTAHATSPTMIGQTLALPALDRLLGWLLDRPRVLQVAGVLVGIFLAALALRPLLSSAAPVSLAVTNATPAQSATASPSAGSAEQAVIDLVAAYNQASIAAAVLGRADAMAPYLAPDGTAWADAQAEYGRRATRGES